jgi:hypothetical protein
MKGARWRKGDRVVVKIGEHAGRHGTINMLPTDDLAVYYNLHTPNVRVALDGEAGQGSRGGRGGVPIDINPADLDREAS